MNDEMFNNTLVPVFRAERTNREGVVFGVPRIDSLGHYEMIFNVMEDGVAGVSQRYIIADTLSISFPDMVDGDGNRVFASLNPYKKGVWGRGGDLIEFISQDSGEKIEGVLAYRNGSVVLLTPGHKPDSILFSEISEIAQSCRKSGISACQF